MTREIFICKTYRIKDVQIKYKYIGKIKYQFDTNIIFIAFLTWLTIQRLQLYINCLIIICAYEANET